MKYLMIIMGFMVCLPVQAHHTEKPYILASIVQDNESRDAYQKAHTDEHCPKGKKLKFKERMACIKEASGGARSKYPLRGTDEYCQKHYAGLSDAGAKAKLDELTELKKDVRSGDVNSRKLVKGELNYGMLESEIFWLKKALKIDRRSRLQQVDSNLQKLWDEGE